MGSNVFGAPREYKGLQFHFHAGSEHTIDGIRHDFEMHTVHEALQPANDIGFAAVGILFSVDKYTADLTKSQQKIIDQFFDSLQW